jgi:hypothetical protein
MQRNRVKERGRRSGGRGEEWKPRKAKDISRRILQIVEILQIRCSYSA